MHCTFGVSGQLKIFYNEHIQKCQMLPLSLAPNFNEKLFLEGCAQSITNTECLYSNLIRGSSRKPLFSSWSETTSVKPAVDQDFWSLKSTITKEKPNGKQPAPLTALCKCSLGAKAVWWATPEEFTSGRLLEKVEGLGQTLQLLEIAVPKGSLLMGFHSWIF